MEKRDRTSLSVRLRHQVAVLHHRLDQAAAALTAAATPAAIHNTRVAARRLRVLLHAYRRECDSKGGKRYRRDLRELIRDLGKARDADVSRHAIARLAGNQKGSGDSRALFERAVKRYESARDGLRLTIAAPAWQQRLAELRQFSSLSSLVNQNEDFAVTVMYRTMKRRRERLRDAMHHVDRSAKKLHRIRLKVKAMRYLLEGCLSKSAIAGNSELKRLRQIQNCLGGMHDEENLLKSLRAEQRHRGAARDICAKLKARKSRHLHAYKRYRKGLMRLWDGAAFRAPENVAERELRRRQPCSSSFLRNPARR